MITLQNASTAEATLAEETRLTIVAGRKKDISVTLMTTLADGVSVVIECIVQERPFFLQNYQGEPGIDALAELLYVVEQSAVGEWRSVLAPE